MAQTPAYYRAQGDAIDYTPGTAVIAGQVVVLGDLVGIAKLPIAANALGALHVKGIFDVPKDGSSFTQGQKVHWDVDGSPVSGTASSGAATDGAAAGPYMGLACASAAAGAATVRVLLAQIPGDYNS